MHLGSTCLCDRLPDIIDLGTSFKAVPPGFFSQPHCRGQIKAELFRQSLAGRASSVPFPPQVCLSYFSYCCDHTPRQKQPKGGRVYFGSYFECVIPGDLVQVLEVAGLIASVVRRQTEKTAPAQLAFSLCSSRPKPREWHHPYLQGVGEAVHLNQPNQDNRS